MKSRQSLILSALAAIFVCGMPTIAFADSFETYMGEGVSYFKDGNYIKAIESFKNAQAINNIPDIPYNIARSYQKLGDCDNALKYFREYALLGAENAQKVSSHIEELTAQCGNKTGSIQMRCVQENAMVYIDTDAPIACNGIYDLPVGEHTLKFTSTGYADEVRTVEIAENVRKTVVIDMVANVEAAAEVTETREVETSSNGIDVRKDLDELFWAGAGTAGGGLILSIIGVSMAATSHRTVTYNHRQFYERSTSKLVGGTVTAGIGLAAMTAGAAMLIIDHVRPKNLEYSTTVVPSIAVTPDSASAGVVVTF